jgi:hypothetical protein
MKQILKVIKISFASTAFLAGLATAQTGQCHSTGNNGASCTADSQCTGTGTPYCAVLKHIIFIIKENRSFDQFLGRYPGVMGGPVGTASVPYPCVYTPSAAGGCPASGTLPGIAVVNTHKDADCGHNHYDAYNDVNLGAMNRFNKNCSGSSDWANVYGAVCSDYTTSGQACATNGDCTSGSCNQNTLSTYWGYAQSYGLADHMFASESGPSYPNHLYIWTAQSSEDVDNPTTSSMWSCDGAHSGRCSNSPSTLCTVANQSTTCGPGNTCTINKSSGFGYFNSSTSCTKDGDLNFNISSITVSAGTATAKCTTNCGSLSVGTYGIFEGSSVAGYNTGPCSRRLLFRLDDHESLR